MIFKGFGWKKGGLGLMGVKFNFLATSVKFICLIILLISMNHDIYFPIRSNIHFFEQKANQPPLISRIKQSILMYNNLIFDDGGYTLSCNGHGSFDSIVPPNQLDRFKLEVPEEASKEFFLNAKDDRTGKPFSLIPHSKNSKNYGVSFRKLLNDMNIENESFVKFELQELTPDGKKVLNDAVRKTSDYKKFIDGNSFFQNKIFENFHNSILISNSLNTPFILDSLHNNLLKNISQNIIKTSDARLEVFNRINELLQLKMPDFSSMKVDDVLDLRKDKLFEKFRDKLLDINKNLMQKEILEFDKSQIDALFVNELLKEIKELAPSIKKLLISGTLGVAGAVPIAGVAASGIGVVKDGISTFKFSRSWLAFIIKNAE